MSGNPALRWLGALLAVAIGALDLTMAPSRYPDSAWVGSLLVFGAIGMGGVAILLWVDWPPKVREFHLRAWRGGALLAFGYAVAFVVSRTVGFPGYHDTGWAPMATSWFALLVVFMGMTALAHLPRRRPAYPSEPGAVTRTRERSVAGSSR